MIDLNQILHEEKRKQRLQRTQGRAFERHLMDQAFGTLRYRGRNLRCQILDLSVGGCCLETEEPFTAGAIAGVEVHIALFGIEIQIPGQTQWIEDENLIGIKFIHPGVRTKNQVASIISCLMDPNAAESVRAALQKPAPEAEVAGELVEVSASSLDAVRGVHGDKTRVKSPKLDDWPLRIRFLNGGPELSGYIAEISAQGMSIRLTTAYTGALDLAVEVGFEVEHLHFRVAGYLRSVYQGEVAGVQFSAMSSRRREELEQQIEEIGRPLSARKA